MRPSPSPLTCSSSLLLYIFTTLFLQRIADTTTFSVLLRIRGTSFVESYFGAADIRRTHESTATTPSCPIPLSYANQFLIDITPHRQQTSTNSSIRRTHLRRPHNVLLSQNPPPKTAASLRNLYPSVSSLSSAFTGTHRRHPLPHTLDPEPDLLNPPRDLLANRLPIRPPIRHPFYTFLSSLLRTRPSSRLNSAAGSQANNSGARMAVGVARRTAIWDWHGLRTAGPTSAR